MWSDRSDRSDQQRGATPEVSILYAQTGMKRLYIQIVEHVCQMARDGRLKPGDRLPPERELASQLNASRASVREALAALEVLGVVDSRPGIGNVVRDGARLAAWPPPPDLLGSVSPHEILEARLMFEPVAATLAAKRAQPDDIKVLRDMLDRMRHCVRDKDWSMFHSLDREFHAFITSLTRNDLISSVLGTVFEQMKERLWTTLKTQSAHDASRFSSYQEAHETIVDCLESGDCERTKEVMRQHISKVGADLFGVEEPAIEEEAEFEAS